MALVQKRLAPKKRNLLVIIVVAFIGISAVLVVQNYWKPGTSTTTDDGSSETLNVRDVPIYTDLGIDVLQDPRWQELKMPKMTLPIEPGTVGRANPFVDAPKQSTQ
ncbi:MAG: hypothetical protein WC497_00430 [Patescibacteria group bacterium]